MRIAIVLLLEFIFLIVCLKRNSASLLCLGESWDRIRIRLESQLELKIMVFPSQEI